MRPVKIPPQLFRLVLLTIGIVASYLVARYLLTPPTFGQYGWYRGAALEQLASRKITYAGQKACDECHSEEIKKVAAFEHKTISCEACHGPAQAHADDPGVDVTKPTDGLCLRCHETDPARPAWLRQMDPKTHYTGRHCVECHVPHQPNEVP